MTAITTLGVDNLSLRGAGTEYNLCTRLFATKAEADAALALGAASGGWVPTAGKTNICLTADEGILKYDFNTTALVNSDDATRAYVDAQVAALVDSAPGALNTLNELAAAINDDANAFNTLNNAIAAVQADVDQNETDADAAIAAVQADVNQNETDSDAADAALSARITTLEADPTTATAVAAVQADVDQNEADADTAIALKADIASPTFTGTPTAPTASAGTNTTQLATTAYVSAAVASLIDGAPGAINTLNELAAALGDDANFATTITNSIASVQSDVDQNETDADAAIAGHNTRLNSLEGNAAITDPTTATALAAVQADVDANETASDNAEAALSGRLDTLEADPTTKSYVDTSTATEAAARQATDTTLSNRIATLEADPTTATAVAAVQADVNQNESDADAALALKAPLASPDFTGQVDIDTNARIEFADNLTKIHNVLRGTSINIGNNIEVKPAAAGGRVEITGDLIIDASDFTDAADDTAAAAAGVVVGQVYRSGSDLKVRVS